MAVYTEVTLEQADALARRLGLGAATDLQGIRSGIENTNYYLTTARGQWVLTLFERMREDALHWCIGLMRHLAERGVPVPAPQVDARGQAVQIVAGKNAAVVTRLPGSHRMAPDADHCAQLGHTLGRMHREGRDYAPVLPHPRRLDWCLQTAAVVAPYLEAPQRSLLDAEIAFQREVDASAAGRALPLGPIHADLFRDNAMYDDTAGDDRLCGVFDFYFGGTGALLFDVAVVLNDWCIDAASGRLDEARARALVAAYAAERPLDEVERRLLPAQMRLAALRFWLSRLADWHLPRPASMLVAKDPTHFERVLRERIEHPWHPGTAAS